MILFFVQRSDHPPVELSAYGQQVSLTVLSSDSGLAIQLYNPNKRMFRVEKAGQCVE